MTRVLAVNTQTGLEITFETLKSFRQRITRWRDLEDWFFKVVK